MNNENSKSLNIIYVFIVNETPIKIFSDFEGSCPNFSYHCSNTSYGNLPWGIAEKVVF